MTRLSKERALRLSPTQEQLLISLAEENGNPESVWYFSSYRRSLAVLERNGLAKLTETTKWGSGHAITDAGRDFLRRLETR